MNPRSKRMTVRVVRAAVVAALYAGLSLALPWISFGPVQFRVSEALTILPLIFPESVIGVSVGCAIANAVGSTAFDVAIGAPTTLVAAALTFMVGRTVRNTPLKLTLGVLPPILLNAMTVPFVFLLTGAGIGYWFGLGTVLAGQTICIVGLGVPLYFATARVYKSAAYGDKSRRAPNTSSEVSSQEADGKD